MNGNEPLWVYEKREREREQRIERRMRLFAVVMALVVFVTVSMMLGHF